MIKLMKLASILVALCAVGLVVFVVILAIQGDQQIEKLLNAPNVIDIFRKSAKTTEPSGDQVSPLVQFAKAFALRINPPPPPKPKRSKTPSKSQTAKATRPDRPTPKVSVRAKFKVLATCRYEQQPARSLVLVDRPPQGLKWFQQGEKVGHLTIQEVRDGSVLCSDGQELFVPPSKTKTKTLLKSDLVDSVEPMPTLVTPAEVGDGVVDTLELVVPKTQSARERVRPRRRSLPGVPGGANVDPDSAKRRRVRRLPEPKPRNLPPEPTPQQESEVLTDSIETIRQMMDRPEAEAGDAEKAEELKMWQQLLESLEKEREEIETDTD